MTIPKSLETRDIAVTLIGNVLRARQSFENAYESHISISKMQSRDRAFVRNLVLTTFRRLGQIDSLINQFLLRPLPDSARDVRDILRIGACQVLFMNVADHGSVDTCVKLTRHRGHNAHIKLVNAILRRLTREGLAALEQQDVEKENTPSWLWRSWSEAYGEEQCRQIAAAHLRGGCLDLSVKGDPQTCASTLRGQMLPMGTVRLSSRGQITKLAGFRQGDWWVQDVAARMVAKLVGDVRGKTVIDLCAAPGGKTLLFSHEGANVVAVDRSASRLRRLRENLDRLNLKAEIIEADVGKWQPENLADIVFLDAPCSATGTARRHPDVLWTKSEADIENLARVQSRMLSTAAKMVAPGGILVFATCSLLPVEGEYHVSRFLEENPLFRLSPISASDVNDFDQIITQAGTFRSLPSFSPAERGMDGFFAARFAR